MMEKLKASIRSVQRKLSAGALNIASKGPVRARLYHAFFDDALTREAHAIAYGRKQYLNDQSAPSRTYFLLRRNIHRLEKGLIMRPRRPVFATDYLGETIDVYRRAVSHAGGCYTNEHLWARDVLKEYFAVVDLKNPIIAREYANYQKVPAPTDATEATERRVPYARSLGNGVPVEFADFLDLSIRRRSVRWFLDQPVPREMLDKAVTAAAQAPSACNRQPFVYRVFDDPVRARELASIPMGTKGFSDKLQSVIVVVGRLRAYPEARDRHAIYIDSALSAMALMYALETQGIASCAINWPDVQPQESLMTKQLGLAPDERVIMLIAYGWPDPDGLVPHSAKRDLDEIRIYG